MYPRKARRPHDRSIPSYSKASYDDEHRASAVQSSYGSSGIITASSSYIAAQRVTLGTGF